MYYYYYTQTCYILLHWLNLVALRLTHCNTLKNDCVGDQGTGLMERMKNKPGFFSSKSIKTLKRYTTLGFHHGPLSDILVNDCNYVSGRVRWSGLSFPDYWQGINKLCTDCGKLWRVEPKSSFMNLFYNKLRGALNILN